MNSEFHDKVVGLIPSRSLKEHIARHGHTFGEKDLLKIILDHAGTFDARIAMFDEAARVLSDAELRRLAKKRRDVEANKHRTFMQPSPDEIYYIELKFPPRLGRDCMPDDTLAARTFDDAVEIVKRYVKYYECSAAERRGARYTLRKMTVALSKKPSDFYKSKTGEIGRCVLDGKYEILDLDMYAAKREVPCAKDKLCDECNRCIEVTAPRFPHFLQPYDLIGYYDDIVNNPTHMTYGIFDCDMEKCDDDTHVALLETNKYIVERNIDYRDENGYYRVYDAHTHPSYCEIEKLDPADVPPKIAELYRYAADGLRKIEETD